MRTESIALFDDHRCTENLIEEYLPLPKDVCGVAVPLSHTKKTGHSAIFRNTAATKTLVHTVHRSFATYYDYFSNSVQLYGDRNCLGHRRYDESAGKFVAKFSWLTYEEVGQRVKHIGSGIIHAISINPFCDLKDSKKGNFIVSLFSSNRPEWVLTDLASTAYSLTTTSLYNTLGPQSSRYILELTESPIVVCSKDKIRTLLKLKSESSSLSSLICIVSMDTLICNDPIFAECKSSKIVLYDFNHLELLGSQNIHPIKPPSSNDLYTISFTSGTTGANPKGVMLTHKACAAGIASTVSTLNYPSEPTAYSFLPLAHIFERKSIAVSISLGGAIGFPHSGSPTTMIEDLRILKPTQLSFVPRVYTKLEAKLRDHLHKLKVSFEDSDGSLKSGTGTSISQSSKSISSPFSRSIIESSRKLVGFDNVIYCTTGSAPIAAQTLSFLRSVLNIGIHQGYGLTESFAGITISSSDDNDPGSCGPVGITSEVKTKDIVEMGYTSEDEGGPRGEILIRGTQMFSGYYKNSIETAKVIDEDGWLHTGDVGRIDETGKVFIVDRVKNFFKMAQGEFVTPEKIENLYLSAVPMINQLYVHGDSLKPFLVAIAGVDVQGMSKYLQKERGVSSFELNTEEKLLRILKDRSTKRFILKHMNELVGQFGLLGFEKIQNAHFSIEPLTIASDVVTPTLKIKRPAALKHFRSTLQSLYEEDSLISKSKL